MKPDWDKLGEEYAASSSVVIGDADCTDSGEALCTQFEVRGCKYNWYRLCFLISNDLISILRRDLLQILLSSTLLMEM